MDEYTPYGYLDNPWHSAALHPSGVVRCQPAIGFAWHYPAFPGPYARHLLYRAALRLALLVDGRPLLAAEDFVAAGVSLVSRLHSKDIISFDWRCRDVASRAAFFLHGEDALCCRLGLLNEGSQAQTVDWAMIAEYERNVGAGSAWDCGLVTYARDAESVALLAYPDGEAMVLCLDRSASGCATAASLPDLLAQLPASQPARRLTTPPLRGPASIHAALSCSSTILPGQASEVLAILGRGRAERFAVRSARAALAGAAPQIAAHMASADHFRSLCPQLSGDWPAHWRRGLVYDFETLRAIVRRPIGHFRHYWDAMQLQSPRLVLAEAALDALAMSFAEPKLANDVLLGAFADSRAPNAPCSREDGSYNMVAEDGEACGTSPAWGFPLHCADLIFQRTGDLRWLKKIYPRLSRYLSWWLRHRSDDLGWLHYHCSWESGQDDSPRFGSQQLCGGSPIDHIRPVDLHAAVAHGAAVLARFSRQLERTRAAIRWQRVADRYAGLTRSLWQGDWFHDYDERALAPTSFRDVMHFAPLLAGQSSVDRHNSLRSAYDSLPPHGVWPPLDWPPVVFTAIEAASAAGWHDIAGSLAAQVAERAYRAYDTRQPNSEGPMPGIASELWATRGSWGCEGYGWGALCSLIVVRHIVGWQEHPLGGIELHPALPDDWLVPGRRYSIGPICYRGRSFRLTYQPQTDGLAISLDGRFMSQASVNDSSGRRVECYSTPQGIGWRASNGGSYHTQLT